MLPRLFIAMDPGSWIRAAIELVHQGWLLPHNHSRRRERSIEGADTMELPPVYLFSPRRRPDRPWPLPQGRFCFWISAAVEMGRNSRLLLRNQRAAGRGGLRGRSPWSFPPCTFSWDGTGRRHGAPTPPPPSWMGHLRSPLSLSLSPSRLSPS
jgi:hypothetical protein